jgi:hypothetical protein
LQLGRTNINKVGRKREGKKFNRVVPYLLSIAFLAESIGRGRRHVSVSNYRLV